MAPTSEVRENTDTENSVIPKFLTAILWSLLFASLIMAFWTYWTSSTVTWNPLIRIDGLTTIMWVVVTLIAAVVMSYSLRYMSGNKYFTEFFVKILLFTFTVAALTATNHLLVFAGLWILMGWIMGKLIGHEKEWPQARAAGRLSFKYFATSSGYLLVSFLMLYHQTGTWMINGVISNLEGLSPLASFVIITGLILAAMIQSALFPVQAWIMSSMTAPTPASALMHAGFVNAGGILLTRFAPVLTEYLIAMVLISSIGAISAMLGKIWKMAQPNVKRQLGCSTVAQMGFMILQCGLGFFSAAITHLILHGFYKGYLFLASGEAVEQTSPKLKSRTRDLWLEVPVSLITGMAGGWLFVSLTGKGTKFNSGLMLTGIVVVTVMHATRELIDHTRLPNLIRALAFPAIVLLVTSVYAEIFLGLTTLMNDVPQAIQPTPFSVVHTLIGAFFLLTYLAVDFHWYEYSKRLYVAVLNAGQPHPATVLSSKEEYHG